MTIKDTVGALLREVDGGACRKYREHGRLTPLLVLLCDDSRITMAILDRCPPRLFATAGRAVVRGLKARGVEVHAAVLVCEAWVKDNPTAEDLRTLAEGYGVRNCPGRRDVITYVVEWKEGGRVERRLGRRPVDAERYLPSGDLEVFADPRKDDPGVLD